MKKMRNIIWTWIFDYVSTLLIVSGYEYNYVCLDHLNVWMWSENNYRLSDHHLHFHCCRIQKRWCDTSIVGWIHSEA